MLQSVTLACFIVASACAAPARGAGAAVPVRALDPAQPWHGDNRARLDQLIAEYGSCSPGYDPSRPPVAVFDWDNTIIKNDIGDASFIWLVQHGKILQPPSYDWFQTSLWLTPEGAAALLAACGRQTPPGQPLPSDTSTACADELLSMYLDAKTTGGAPGFRQTGYNHRWQRPEYAWAAQLQAGYTPEQIRSFSREVIAEQLTQPVGATKTVGTRTDLGGYIRIYEPIRDLIGALQANGLAVWVLSASPEPVVQAFAAHVNVAPDRVVGIRTLLDAAGRLTYRLAGCGTAPDAGDLMITYMDGKRCWMNQAIFGRHGAAALEPGPGPVFAAGDAETDVTFLRDAHLRLVIDRQKPELMCHALFDEDGGWMVNPMFIDPKAPRTTPYPCAASACIDAAGANVPCQSSRGEPIPDQSDPFAGAP